VVIALIFAWMYASICQASRLQEPPPPPPPARDYYPAKRERFTFESGHFSACFPGKPAETTETNGSGPGSITQVFQYKGLLTYRVSYVDFGVQIVEKSKVKDFLQAMKSVMIKADKKPDVKLVDERTVEVQGYEGLYFQLDEGDKSTIRIQVVPVGSRVYIISVEGHRGRPYEMEGKDNFAKIATGFIGSFQITP
jgi:hypothetical protein